MEKVTIAMPVYNVENYVEKSLLSAINQTFENIEFLIIDDKGADNSMAVVRKIMETHPRGKDIRIIDHIVNKGTGATKNSAIKEATGDYLFFMDSDDEITPNCIQLMYDKMQEHPVDFVVGSVLYRYSDGSEIVKVKYEDAIIEGNYNVVMQRCAPDRLNIPTWNKLYNLSFLRRNKVECVPYHLNEDNVFTTQVILAAKSYQALSNITYIQYYRTDSTMGKMVKGYSSVRQAKEYIEIADFLKTTLAAQAGTNIYPIFYKYISCRFYGFISSYIRCDKLTAREKCKYLSQLYRNMPSNSILQSVKFTTIYLMKIIIAILPNSLRNIAKSIRDRLKSK